MTTPRKARASRGFTLIELLAYLAIFTAVSGTIVEAELSARRMHKYEGVTLETIYKMDRLFASIAEDCDRASGVSVEQDGRELRFAGGSSYVLKGGEIARDGKPVAKDIREIGFTRPPEPRSRLLFVKIHVARDLGNGELFERRYERTFLLRNLEGDGRGGL
jgi:prepilin-type N-terminal cleavage/methylation domain-containing protein